MLLLGSKDSAFSTLLQLFTQTVGSGRHVWTYQSTVTLFTLCSSFLLLYCLSWSFRCQNGHLLTPYQ